MVDNIKIIGLNPNPSPTPTKSITPSFTQTPTKTQTQTPSPSITLTNTRTPTVTRTPTATKTRTVTPTKTVCGWNGISQIWLENCGGTKINVNWTRVSANNWTATFNYSLYTVISNITYNINLLNVKGKTCKDLWTITFNFSCLLPGQQLEYDLPNCSCNSPGIIVIKSSSPNCMCVTPTPTKSVTPSFTTTPTITKTNTVTPSNTITLSPTNTTTITPTKTNTVSPTKGLTPTPTNTSTITPTATQCYPDPPTDLFAICDPDCNKEYSTPATLVSLSWTPPIGSYCLQGYEIQMLADGDVVDNLYTAWNTSQAELFPDGRTYTFRVRSSSGLGMNTSNWVIFPGSFTNNECCPTPTPTQSPTPSITPTQTLSPTPTQTITPSATLVPKSCYAVQDVCSCVLQGQSGLDPINGIITWTTIDSRCSLFDGYQVEQYDFTTDSWSLLFFINGLDSYSCPTQISSNINYTKYRVRPASSINPLIYGDWTESKNVDYDGPLCDGSSCNNTVSVYDVSAQCNCGVIGTESSNGDQSSELDNSILVNFKCNDNDITTFTIDYIASSSQNYYQPETKFSFPIESKLLTDTINSNILELEYNNQFKKSINTSYSYITINNIKYTIISYGTMVDKIRINISETVNISAGSTAFVEQWATALLTNQSMFIENLTRNSDNSISFKARPNTSNPYGIFDPCVPTIRIGALGINRLFDNFQQILLDSIKVISDTIQCSNDMALSIPTNLTAQCIRLNNNTDETFILLSWTPPANTNGITTYQVDVKSGYYTNTWSSDNDFNYINQKIWKNRYPIINPYDNIFDISVIGRNNIPNKMVLPGNADYSMFEGYLHSFRIRSLNEYTGEYSDWSNIIADINPYTCWNHGIHISNITVGNEGFSDNSREFTITFDQNIGCWKNFLYKTYNPDTINSAQWIDNRTQTSDTTDCLQFITHVVVPDGDSSICFKFYSLDSNGNIIENSNEYCLSVPPIVPPVVDPPTPICPDTILSSIRVMYSDTKGPNPGGHHCNRAQFNLYINDIYVGDVNLNNGGGDTDPGPPTNLSDFPSLIPIGVNDRGNKFSIPDSIIPIVLDNGSLGYKVTLQCNGNNIGECGTWIWNGTGSETCYWYSLSDWIDDQGPINTDTGLPWNCGQMNCPSYQGPNSSGECGYWTDGTSCYSTQNCCAKFNAANYISAGCHTGIAWIELLDIDNNIVLSCSVPVDTISYIITDPKKCLGADASIQNNLFGIELLTIQQLY